MATSQAQEPQQDVFPKKITVGSEPTRILLADQNRKPLIIRRIDPKCKVIFNQIAGSDGNSQEVNLSGGGGITQMDGTYKGEVWASTNNGEVVLLIQEVEESN